MNRTLDGMYLIIERDGERPLAWNKGEYELGLQNKRESDVDAIKNVTPAQSDVPDTNAEDITSSQAGINVLCKAE